MKEITSQNQGQQDSWKTCVTLGTIDRLFLKFTARYGSRFTSQFDDEALLKMAKAEWYDGLKHFNNGDIKQGLDSWNGNWPPNLIEFRTECRPAPCYKEYSQKALPPVINKNTGEEALSNIRDMLK